MKNIEYWTKRYQQNNTGWDLSTVSPPLKAYFDQLKSKDISILIPGAGNAYEAEYLHKKGFQNISVLDCATEPLANLKNRVPDFPEKNIFQEDFFEHHAKYDLIIEQTFFCAIDPIFRKKYVDKMHSLLKLEGKLVGLLFNIPLYTEHPPYGGSKEEYLELFKPKFELKCIETAYNSIKPRTNNELFIIFNKN